MVSVQAHVKWKKLEYLCQYIFLIYSIVDQIKSKRKITLVTSRYLWIKLITETQKFPQRAIQVLSEIIMFISSYGKNPSINVGQKLHYTKHPSDHRILLFQWSIKELFTLFLILYACMKYSFNAMVSNIVSTLMVTLRSKLFENFLRCS